MYARHASSIVFSLCLIAFSCTLAFAQDKRGTTTETAYHLKVPYFGQTLEWPWGSDFMGDSRALIADNGCILCCVAMALAYHGVDTDPRRLDRALIKAEAYLPLDYAGERIGRIGFDFGAVPRLFPEIKRVEQRGVFRAASDAEYARQAIASGLPVVLVVTSPKGFNHAVLAVGFSGDDFVIADPLDQATRSLRQGYGGGRDGNFEGLIQGMALYYPRGR